MSSRSIAILLSKSEMFLIILLSLLTVGHGANILVMLPLSATSHVYTFMPLFEKLVEHGHNITIVSSYEGSKTRTNLTMIKFGATFQSEMKSVKNKEEIIKKFNEISKMSKYEFLPKFWNLFIKLYEELLKKGIIQNLLDESSSYDLMISETHNLQETFIVFAYIYGIPVINIDPHFPSVWACYLTGNVCPSSYIPNFKTSYSDRMSLTERIKNTILNLEELLGNYFYFIPQQEKLIRKYFKHPKISNLPPLLKLLKNTSLTLIDSHFSQSYPRAYAPNIIEVGGLSLNINTSMDEDLEKYMNESEHGVIYFTFGSVLPIQLLPNYIISSFLKAFENVEQNVIMKWDENIHLDKKPENVKLMNWAPQNSILAHPKCVLFISHGGIHSLTEAIYHAVPLLLVPFFSDQHFNSKFAEINGIGYIIEKENISSKNVLAGINEVLLNPFYKTNTEKRSQIIKDKPLNPVDIAVYWVEYILRHKGALHLQPASLDLNIFEYIILDIGFLFISTFFGTIAVVYICKHFTQYLIRKLHK